MKRGKTNERREQQPSIEFQNVKVAIRCRPSNERERSKLSPMVIQCEPSRKEVSVMLNSNKLASYNFDSVFDHTATQQQVYSSVVAEVVEDALKGFNCTVFAYGQTGTGKTYTMEGKRAEYDWKSPSWYGSQAGMIPRATQHIFQHLENNCSDYTVHVSYLELYNEELIDLLSPDHPSSHSHNSTANSNEKSLNIRFDETRKGVVVSGLEEVKVKSPEDLFHILDTASQKRQTAETLLNKHSSRSHCIFTITIHTKESADNGEDLLKVGKLNLVDLAGSENTKRSGAKDERLKEAVMINKSLLTLGRVITALTSSDKENNKDHYIPYRDSKLTRLLQESLGGKAKTCIIATISPFEDCLEETRSTLKYAFRAKSIKNSPILNQQFTSKALIKEYVSEIENLKNQLYAARAKDGFHVDKKSWDDLHLELEILRSKVSDLTSDLEVKDAKLDELATELASRDAQLESLKAAYTSLNHQHDLLSAEFAQSQEDLRITRENLSDSQYILSHHQLAEQQLLRQSQSLISSLASSSSDIQKLHQKIDRSDQLIAANQNTLNTFQKFNDLQFKQMKNKNEEFISKYLSQSDTLSTLFNEFDQLKSIEFDDFQDQLEKLVNEMDKAKEAIQSSSELMMLYEKSSSEDFVKFHNRYLEKIKGEKDQFLSQLSQLLNSLQSSLFKMKKEHKSFHKDLLESFASHSHLISSFSTSQLAFHQSMMKGMKEREEKSAERIRKEKQQLNGFVEAQKKLLSEKQQGLEAAVHSLLDDHRKLLSNSLFLSISQITQSLDDHNEEQQHQMEEIVTPQFTKQIDHLLDFDTQIRESNDEIVSMIDHYSLDQFDVSVGDSSALVSDIHQSSSSFFSKLQSTDDKHKLKFLNKSQRTNSERMKNYSDTFLPLLHSSHDLTTSLVESEAIERVRKLKSLTANHLSESTSQLAATRELVDNANRGFASEMNSIHYNCSNLPKQMSLPSSSGATPKKSKLYPLPSSLPITPAHSFLIDQRRSRHPSFPPAAPSSFPSLSLHSLPADPSDDSSLSFLPSSSLPLFPSDNSFSSTDQSADDDNSDDLSSHLPRSDPPSDHIEISLSSNLPSPPISEAISSSSTKATVEATSTSSATSSKSKSSLIASKENSNNVSNVVSTSAVGDKRKREPTKTTAIKRRLSLKSQQKQLELERQAASKKRAPLKSVTRRPLADHN